MIVEWPTCRGWRMWNIFTSADVLQNSILRVLAKVRDTLAYLFELNT
jgi:hypothetical protein